MSRLVFINNKKLSSKNLFFKEKLVQIIYHTRENVSSKVYPCEIILSGENVQNACNIVELIQVKSKEIHSRKYQISIGHVCVMN